MPMPMDLDWTPSMIMDRIEKHTLKQLQEPDNLLFKWTSQSKILPPLEEDGKKLRQRHKTADQ
jgi:hypothetical protein